MCDNRILGKGSDNIVYDFPFDKAIYRTPIDPTTNANEQEQATILAILTRVHNEEDRFLLSLPTRPLWTIKL